jgi:hypothetical protein
VAGVAPAPGRVAPALRLLSKQFVRGSDHES